MVKTDETVIEILSRAEETLFTVKLGLDEITGNQPRKRIAGVRNLIVFGRAVTNVLQNLRGIVSDFDNWYQPYVTELKANPLFRFFYEARSEILKQGKLNTHSSLAMSGNPFLLMQKFPRPPHAKSFFIGDKIGGSGWEIEMPDGAKVKYYVDLPNEIPGFKLDLSLHLDNAPEGFRDLPALEACQKYYDYLEHVVIDAKRKYCS